MTRLSEAEVAQLPELFRLRGATGTLWALGRGSADPRAPRLPAQRRQVRNMLLSGEFVWMQFQTSTIEDWAACAVQYTRALENELHRRLYDPCGLRLVIKDGTPMQPKQFTIGVVLFLYSERNRRLTHFLIQLSDRPSASARSWRVQSGRVTSLGSVQLVKLMPEHWIDHSATAIVDIIYIDFVLLIKIILNQVN